MAGPFGMQVDPVATPWFLAAGLMVILALLLLRLDWRGAANRALATFFVVGAAYNVGLGLADAGTGPAWLFPVASLAVPLAALHFALVHRVPEDERQGVGAMLGALFLLLCAIYLIEPALWSSVDAQGVVHVGPLWVAVGLVKVAHGTVTLLFVLSYLRAHDPARRRSFLTAALGFSFLPTYGALSELMLVEALGLRSLSEVSYAVTHYVTVAAFLPIAGVFYLLGRHTWRTQHEAAKRDMARLLLAFLLPVLSVLAVLLIYGVQDAAAAVAADFFFEGVWGILSPLLIAYAVFRQRLYGLEQRVERMLEQIVMTGLYLGMVGATFQAARQQASTPWSVAATLVVVVLLVVLHKRILQRVRLLLKHAPPEQTPRM